jgi:hypothetical protein
LGQFHYQVIRHQRGWAYRLEDTYSRVFPTQWEAVAAAKSAAIKMHEPGDETLVRVQDGGSNWRLELAIRGSMSPSGE